MIISAIYKTDFASMWHSQTEVKLGKGDFKSRYINDIASFSLLNKSKITLRLLTTDQSSRKVPRYVKWQYKYVKWGMPWLNIWEGIKLWVAEGLYTLCRFKNPTALLNIWLSHHCKFVTNLHLVLFIIISLDLFSRSATCLGLAPSAHL